MGDYYQNNIIDNNHTFYQFEFRVLRAQHDISNVYWENIHIFLLLHSKPERYWKWIPTYPFHPLIPLCVPSKYETLFYTFFLSQYCWENMYYMHFLHNGNILKLCCYWNCEFWTWLRYTAHEVKTSKLG